MTVSRPENEAVCCRIKAQAASIAEGGKEGRGPLPLDLFHSI